MENWNGETINTPTKSILAEKLIQSGWFVDDEFYQFGSHESQLYFSKEGSDLIVMFFSDRDEMKVLRDVVENNFGRFDLILASSCEREIFKAASK